MCVFSAPGTIEFFPVLPDELKRGCLEGVWLYTWTKLERLTWDETGMEARLHPLKDQTLTFRLRRPARSFRINGREMLPEGDRVVLPVKAGEPLVLEADWRGGRT